MAALRAGLVGMGVMGRHHARVLSALDGVEFVGVADPGVLGRGDLASREVFPTIDDLLRRGVDYCVVAVPTAFHEEVGLTLADAGVHALVEKPLSVDSASAVRMAHAFDQAGLIGAVGHIERYNPALQEARQRMASGDLGEVYQIVTRRQGPFPARIADVGVVMDLATHDIDLTSWIAGARFVAVAAQAGFRSGRVHEDLVSIVGRLSNGVVTNHLVNWLSPFKERTTVITGELGAFVADTLTADLTFHANGVVATEWDEMAQFRGVREGDVVRYAFPKPEPLRTEHEAFRDAILGRPSDIVTMHAGLGTVRTAEAALLSASEGAVIDILEGDE